MTDSLIIDFETRSAVDLRVHGVTRYTRDSSTKVLCIGFRWQGSTFILPWPKKPPRRILGALADTSVPIVAHNMLFERAVWRNVLGWELPELSRWYCTASRAALWNLPTSLAALSEYLWPSDSERWKDSRGKELIKLLCRPKKDGTFHENPELLQEMYRYCARDVDVTAKVWELLPAPPKWEEEIRQADTAVNERGIYIDRAFCTAASALDQRLADSAQRECEQITGGLRATQTAKLKAWFAERNVVLPDMQRGTILRHLTVGGECMAPEVRRVLELRMAGGRVSASKYAALLRHTTNAHPILTHHTRYADGNTGRWIGYGTQIHNFRGRYLIDADLTRVKQAILSDQLPTDVDQRDYVGTAVRTAIIPRPGHMIVAADYASMENRLLMYFSNEHRQLQIIRDGQDVYKDLAAQIYSVPVADVKIDQRTIAKYMVLGLGFGMGALTFYANLKYRYNVILDHATCRSIVGGALDRLVDDEIEKWRKHPRLLAHIRSQITTPGDPIRRTEVEGVVTTRHLVALFRERYNGMRDWWAELDTAFRELLHARPGGSISVRHCTVHRRRQAIVIVLPSGRPMYYWHPRIQRERDPITDQPRAAVVYQQASGSRVKTHHGYGARWAANIVQAMARDIIGVAYVDLTRTNSWRPLVTIHDEIVAEVRQDGPDAAAFADQIITSAARRDWSREVPIAVDASISPFWTAHV